MPRAEGGQYWPGEAVDQRDFQLGYDSNVKHRNEALGEAFDRLRSNGVLAAGADEGTFMSALRGSRLTNLTEFGRPVHAEMAALLDAARRGAPVAGQNLFATTFPCHNCARHIIAAGIRQVVFREPYEKSLAGDLHKDAVVVDRATGLDGKVVFRRFVGVGPPKYLNLFEMPRRKDREGNKIAWIQAGAMPRLVTTGYDYLFNEDDVLIDFEEALKSIDLGKGAKDGAT